MNLSTDTQKKAAKLLLKATSRKPINRPQATKILTNEEYGVYSRSNDAKDLVKDLVQDETFPVEIQKGKLVRTDMEVA